MMTKCKKLRIYKVNKTVLQRDCKRRTARTPHLQKFPKFCPFFVQNYCPTFLSKFIGGGGIPGDAPPVGGTLGALPQLGVPWGCPPPTSWGYPQGRPPSPQFRGGTHRGAPPPPVLGGTPRGAPLVGGVSPYEQTN